MIDLRKVRNFYIACGYTDLRLGIDGLAAVVKQQYGSHFDEESLFLFCGRRADRRVGMEVRTDAIWLECHYRGRRIDRCFRCVARLR